MATRTMKKFLALLLSLMMIAAVFVVPSVAATDDLEVTVHYQRSDSNYDNWNIWVWADGKDGGQQDFTSSDSFGAVSKFNMDVAGIDKIGFIIRKGEWESKDTDGDRFIETAKAQDGKVDIYVLQGQSEFGYTEAELISPRIKKAKMVSTSQIDFTLSQEANLNASDVTVKDSEGNTYAVASVTTDGKNGSLITSDELPYGKSYKLYIDGFIELDVSTAAVYDTNEFEQKYTYDGNDLGANYTAEKTTFKTWSPLAEKVTLNLYSTGNGDTLIKSVDMTLGDKGVWTAEEAGDLNGVYYTYTFKINGSENEAVDLYARAGGVNGDRGMIIDLKSTNPDGWDSDVRPEFGGNATDAIVYEQHIRDFSIDASSGVSDAHKGKYLAFTETGTKNSNGNSTCLDYLKNLGITHVQIMPAFDFSSVDETKLDKAQYNWGYDPKNYNFPEGSYSTNPYNGEVRINEFKQMVQSLHKSGIRVIMDVVYNHTAATYDSNFNKSFPDYYYRENEDGSFSNGSGCGNETATERSMVRKYIVESVVYWATEYHIDGFRFDLMGLHDQETINEIRAALNEIDPTIITYGEGWTGGSSTLPSSQAALKAQISKMPGFGAFSDDIRDGLKGNVFDEEDTGFVSGKSGLESTVKSGVLGATDSWAGAPTQTINYVSCHDNNTLWDRFTNSCPDATDEEKAAMTKLASSVVFTSQGIPFFLGGEEMCRTKPLANGKLDSNSYKSPDSTNSVKWDTLSSSLVSGVSNYYKGLIEFRKAHPSLRLTTTEDVNNSIKFSEDVGDNVVAYEVSGKPNGEKADSIFVAYNANKEDVQVKLPKSDKWQVCVNGEKAGTDVIETINGDTVTVKAQSTMVLVLGDTNGTPDNSNPEDTSKVTPNDNSNGVNTGDTSTPIVWFAFAGVALLAIAGIVFVTAKKKANR